MNAVLKRTLHHQITLLKALRCLVREVKTFEAKLLMEEVTSMIRAVIELLPSTALLGSPTLVALRKSCSSWRMSYGVL
jgi:hypothetical protein